MHREPGYYWVKIRHAMSTKWVVAMFTKTETDCNWYLPGESGAVKGVNLLEIDENIIKRKD